MVEYHLDLIREAVNIEGVPRRKAVPSVSRGGADVARLVGGDRYIVIHMGSGTSIKEWPVESWAELGKALLATGWRIVLTGSGQVERKQAAIVTSLVTGALNLCDGLKWTEFVEVVAHADLLIGVDSVAGHLAAAVGTKVIVLSPGINPDQLWKPVGDRVNVLTHWMPCAPCFRKAGCGGMECIRMLDAETVLSEATRMLNSSPVEAA
jgi:ADP-heptose:LPS heptosyltransferase